ncbi:TPA: efflux transporter outer membrane subunit [Salmonella enterica subsp. enterica]|nr:efflux transporter outer membrane subunit [Salmonella enterica subsp. enterica]EAM1449862.1 efflux transporter outer membrane subunit [Salmonella enterica]ECU0494993.1 efflux transporter outer membrane subunit [Salmonella enterica subsp. enterica serovar Muenster]EGI4901473.1 efflux transporter outer membrane subunit [Salmonella enterica subsp. enterica serovar Arkansas]EAA9952872.1 efflux transporter outer membrane subunit [Salmonella enterica subsp. enterica]
MRCVSGYRFAHGTKPVRYRPHYLKGCVISVLSLALGSCAAIPDLGTAPQPEQAAALISQRSFSAPHADWPQEKWWMAFGDTQLNQLMSEATAHSPSLAQAEARVREATARTGVARSRLYPSMDASASIDKEKLSYNYIYPKTAVPHGWNDMGQASLNFSWELDFWGKNRDALRAATSEASAAEADAAAAKLMLTTMLADAYIRLQYQYDSRDIAARQLRNRTDTVRLVQLRHAQGLDSRVSVEESGARLDVARAALAEADEQIKLTQNGIAALLGRGPDRGLDILRPRLQMRRPVGLPDALNANLLGRNPEVVAARWRVEAAASNIGVARAQFYPNVNLMAFVGYQSLGLNNLFSSGSDIGSVGPAISLPLFEGGRLRANYKGARAEYEYAVASYNEALTQALRETADVTRSLAALVGRSEATASALSHSEEAYHLAKARYQGGLADYQEVLISEDALLQAELANTAMHSRGYVLDVSLVKALGGGFESSSTFDAQVKP